MHAHHLLGVAALLLAVSTAAPVDGPAASAAIRRRTQSAENQGELSSLITDCSGAFSASAAITAVTQESANSERGEAAGVSNPPNNYRRTAVEVTYSGFTPNTLWLTDEAGTIVAYKNSTYCLGANCAGGSLGATSQSLYWDSPQTSLRPQPLGLQVHSCPPTYNMTAMIRTYRGLYEDILAEVCCPSHTYAAGERATEENTYGARIVNYNWNNQYFRAAWPRRAIRLNYVTDSTGAVLYAAAGSENEGISTTGFTTPYLYWTPMATYIEACALLSNDKNPVCANQSLVADTVGAIGNSPTTSADLTAFGATVSYSGSASAAIATFDTTAPTGWTAMWVKNVSAGSPIAVFANSTSIAVPLNDVTDSIELWTCTQVSLSTAWGVPQCPGNRKKVQIDAAALRTAAQVSITGAMSDVSTFGMMSLSAAMSGASCNGYAVGATARNGTTGQTCTCADQGAWSCGVQVCTVWECAALPETAPVWTSAQIGAVVAVGIIAGLLLIGAAAATVVLKKKGKLPRSTMVAVPQGPVATGGIQLQTAGA